MHPLSRFAQHKQHIAHTAKRMWVCPPRKEQTSLLLMPCLNTYTTSTFMDHEGHEVQLVTIRKLSDAARSVACPGDIHIRSSICFLEAIASSGFRHEQASLARCYLTMRGVCRRFLQKYQLNILQSCPTVPKALMLCADSHVAAGQSDQRMCHVVAAL